MVAAVPTSSGPRTIWGLDPVQLHTHYWASLGVQVVRQGEPSQIVKHAELFLLTDPRSLVTFRLGELMEILNWIQPQVLFVRLHDTRERGYREKVVTDTNDRFVRFDRIYEQPGRLARVVLTPEREVAQLWQSASDPLNGWRRLRRFTPRIDRITKTVDGQVYDRTMDRDIAQFLHDLVRDWKMPDATIARATKSNGAVWIDPKSKIENDANLIGPVWVGAGRTVPKGSTVIGPAVVWDSPEDRPMNEGVQWLAIEPKLPPEDAAPTAPIGQTGKAIKAVFDRVAAIFALLLALPLFPVIMLFIWLEDGSPFFFGHMRETIGGKEFPCWKFRSMRKDAEEIKKQLAKLNQADGPQFFMENDPRLTRTGRILRKYNLDELPQFWNVLTGDMSIVGPRPSPRRENQFCPAWREARLSVRPGITGLWQIRRTRRAGNDFQEWIKYDLEYVENASWKLDITILYKTFMMMVRKGTRQ